MLCGSAGAAEGDEARAWQRLVGILQYLQSDYPDAVRSQQTTELEEQTGFARDAQAAAREVGPGAAPFLAAIDSVARRIERAEDAQGVARDCASLVDALVVAGGLSRSPRRPPDLAHAKELYAAACAACHAQDGSGQVEIAPTMTPRPSSFLDPERMDGITPYKAFNVMTLGVEGTAMPAFSVLNDTERWELAFYIFALRQPPCEVKAPRSTLEKLANITDAALGKQYTPREVACLRRVPPQTDEEQSLLIARSGIEDAMRLSQAGQAQAARQAVMDAYLNGIEPVELLLKGRQPALVQRLEEGFGRLRVDLDNGAPTVEAEGRALLGLVDDARRSHSPTQAWSVFGMTLFILLREGFEATVVIAALLAVLKRTDQMKHARWVHSGWGIALALGVLAFVFARHLLAGTRREWLEAVVALAAVGMLLYAALWLNARRNTRKLMGRLRDQMEGALGRGSRAGLFTIAFTAMLRESFETALFLQGLSIDSPSGVAWGAAGGAVALVFLVTFVVRVGYRLPMKALFTASTVLLFATAVVLLGKGLHALQELGALHVRPLPLFTLDFLGLYPDAYSLLPQLLLAAAPLAWWLATKKAPPAPPLPSGA